MNRGPPRDAFVNLLAIPVQVDEGSQEQTNFSSELAFLAKMETSDCVVRLIIRFTSRMQALNG